MIIPMIVMKFVSLKFLTPKPASEFYILQVQG